MKKIAIRVPLTSVEYLDFYALLKTAFIAKEWPRDRGLPKTEFNVWFKSGVNGPVLTKLFSVNTRYFYDRAVRAGKGKEVSLEEGTIVKVLDYCGFTGQTFEEMMTGFRNSSKRPSKKTNAETGSVAPPVAQSELSRAVEVVLRFYAAVDNGELKHGEAWNCLTPRLKHTICESDFERFCEGYTNTVSIKNVKVFDTVKSGENTVECTVYYTDEFRNYQSKDLSGWDAYTVADLDEFVAQVRKVKAAVAEAGGQAFDRLELYKLFEPGASEYIWYKCRIKRENIDRVFSTFKSVEIKRLYRIRCQQVADEWLIDAIRLLNYHSSR